MAHRNLTTMNYWFTKGDAIGRVTILFFNLLFLGFSNFYPADNLSNLILKIFAYLASISSICFFAFLDWRKVYFASKVFLGNIEYSYMEFPHETTKELLETINTTWVKNKSHEPVYIFADYKILTYASYFNYCSYLIRNKKYKGVVDENIAKSLKKHLRHAYFIDCEKDSLVDCLYNLPKKYTLCKNIYLNTLFLSNYDNSFTIENIYNSTGYRCVLVDKNINSVMLRKLDDQSICKQFGLKDKIFASKINNVVGGDFSKLYAQTSTLDKKNKFFEYIKHGNVALSNIDEIIFQAQEDLKRGEYQNAFTRLITAEAAYASELQINNLRRFLFEYTYADACHLLNKYEEAIVKLLAVLDDLELLPFNADNCVELLIAHCVKHTGNFALAIQKLEDILSQTDCLYVKAKAIRGKIGCLLLENFNCDCTGENSSVFLLEKCFSDINDIYVMAISEKNTAVCDIAEETYYMYKPVCEWFNNKQVDLISEYRNSLSSITSRHSRLKTNARFMYAEAFRLNNQLDKALPLYFECYCDAVYNRDYNLLVQVSVMLRFIELTKNRLSLLRIKNLVELQKQCIEKSMFFNKTLCEEIMQIEIAPLSNESKKITDKYDNNLMIIL